MKFKVANLRIKRLVAGNWRLADLLTENIWSDLKY